MAWADEHLYVPMDLGPKGETMPKAHEVRPLVTLCIWRRAYETIRHAQLSEHTSGPNGWMTDAMTGARAYAGVHDVYWKLALRVEPNCKFRQVWPQHSMMRIICFG